MGNETSNKYKVNTSRWYEDDDINIYLEIIINNEYGGYEANCNYLLKNQFAEEIDNKRLNFIVAVTPSITNAPSTRHTWYYSNNGKVPNDVDYYLNKQKQQVPDEGKRDSRKDVFDEIMPDIIAKRANNAKILFPYNQSDRHWWLAEVIIKRTLNTYNIDLYLHNPFGGGQLESVNFNRMVKSIEERIKNFDYGANFNFSNKRSLYSKRQSDGCSCGVITAEDLLKRIEGESLNRGRAYSYGAIELREQQLQKMQDYETNPIVLAKFIRRNTSSNQSYSSSSFNSFSSSSAPSSGSINISEKPSRVNKDNSINSNNLNYIKYFLNSFILPSLIIIAAFELIKNFLSSSENVNPDPKDNIKKEKLSDDSFSHASKYAKQRSKTGVKAR